MVEFLNKVFSYKYLSDKDLKGFDKYKYSAIDTSPISNYVMHPTWNTITKFIPNNIAPNLLTFSGFLCMVLAVCLGAWYDYDYTAAGKPVGYVGEGSTIPDWFFIVCGILVFLAYNLDGVDGKQARKIGVSGPLGELFDHGLDSYIIFLIPFCLFSAFGRNDVAWTDTRGLLVIVSVTQNFYVSQCEKYNTGTLYLPWGYDFSMWVVIMLFFLTGVYSPAVHKFYLLENMSFLECFEKLVHATGLFTTLPVAIWNVYLYRQDTKRKHLSFLEAIRPVWSMLVMTSSILCWAYMSPNNIVSYDFRAFLFLYGTLFSNVACRLIIRGMAGQRCEAFCWLNWPLLAGLAISFYCPQLEYYVLYALVIISVFAHVHYGICVVRQICEYYKINCLTVPSSVKPKTN